MYRFIVALVCLAVVMLLLGASCSQQGAEAPSVRSGLTQAGDGLYRTELAAAQGSEEGGFSLLSSEDSGIDFRNDVSDLSSTLEQTNINSGVAAGDYDNDGDIDLFLLGLDPDCQLLRNDGELKFTDVTAEAGDGIACSGKWSSGATFADVDGDGNLDLYVCHRNAPNQLFMGDGAGKFTEQSEDRGAGVEGASVSAAIFDADNDGDLDIYVANYRLTKNNSGLRPILDEYNETGSASIPENLEGQIMLDEKGQPRLAPDYDAFLVNDGSGRFTDQTEQAGLKIQTWSYQAQACDVDNDGFIDLYVTSDFEPKDRYMHNKGDGTFEDLTATHFRKTALFGMGADSGDINGDGLPDMIVADMLSRSYKRAKKQSGDMNKWRWEMLNQKPQPQMRNMLYLNRGDGWMTEMAQLCGVHASEWTWSTRIADLNCDGIPEIFCTTGNLMDSMDVDFNNEYNMMEALGTPYEQLNQFMLNQPVLDTDNIIFTASSPLKYQPAPGNWGMLDSVVGCGCVLEDLDNDGDLDIVVNNTNARAGVWRNDFNQGNRMSVELRQPGNNAFGVGARLWAHCGDQQFMRDMILTRGFAGGESSTLCFGLGDHAKVDRLVIRWPDNTVQELTDLDAGFHYLVQKASGLDAWQPEPEQGLFRQEKFDWQQAEVNTQAGEFDKEPLLPMLQSTLGTGVGIADFNGDGNLDAYFCGASGQNGQLYRGTSGGGFEKDSSFDGLLDPAAEEMAALWFEANGDGRPDLLITCGGMEAQPGSGAYEDKLLINGEGGFTISKLPHAETSTGAAAASDIDMDGDLDVVIGGHLIPNAYAVPARSYVLINDGNGGFFDASTSWLAGFASGGQVTDMQFSDIDGDSVPDLLVARKWGSVEYWKTGTGSLVKAGDLTEAGWWTGLGTGDFDNDGDIDVVCGNFGSNLKYHPKPESPITLFANDFDGNGTRDLIEVKYRSDGCMLPGRGRSCSGYAIDYIPVKFPKWDDFANATLEDIYGPGLEGAERFDATELHSMVCLNEGSGNFTVQPLPGSAQWAPAFGIGVTDFDLDGNLDCYLANNFYWTQPETGHWDTGYGVLLLGDGSGGFSDLEPAEAGIRMPDDGRGALACDFSGDGKPDLVVSASDSSPTRAVNNVESNSTVLGVALTGSAGNPAGVGAVVELELDNGTTLKREVHAGQGYLSSYIGPMSFAIPEGMSAAVLRVYWPDGDVSEMTDGLEGMLELKK